jgi:hypothetical protein
MKVAVSMKRTANPPDRLNCGAVMFSGGSDVLSEPA